MLRDAKCISHFQRNDWADHRTTDRDEKQIFFGEEALNDYLKKSKKDHYKKKNPLPVVRPGSQSRRFTHIQDTVEAQLEINNL